MDKVSIIVPVYKVEQYLTRCVNSLTRQTYSNIEILLVDDGSPDNCGLQCDQLAKADSRIVVIHQENQGVSAARNRGLDAMTGDWVCFCDGDDWYEVDFVEKMLKCAKEEGADYIICNYQIASEGSNPIPSSSINGLESGCDKRVVIALGPTPSCTHLICRKLFEVSGVRYPVGCRQSEELPVIPVLAKYATKIGIVKEPLYNYYQRGDGTSASNMAVNSEENFRICWKQMCHCLGEDYRQEAEYHAIYALLYGEVLKHCKRGAAADVIRETIGKFEKEFPEYRSNPYLVGMGTAKRLFLRFAHSRLVVGLRLLSWVHSRIVN